MNIFEVLPYIRTLADDVMAGSRCVGTWQPGAHYARRRRNRRGLVLVRCGCLGEGYAVSGTFLSDEADTRNRYFKYAHDADRATSRGLKGLRIVVSSQCYS